MKPILITLVSLAFGIIIGFALGKASTNTVPEYDYVTPPIGEPQSCTYKGVTYLSGAGFKDDCNSCSCENGEVACTLMACD
ncbi:MAG: hypothetical protein ACD_19C00371G0001 [uncultured bacterium]|uniref:Pacifastin domain-containing protein n=1 Tax=candidate division WWE3 bacterium RIFCSPLOWO2_01_FULL_37_15 TaxID=1802622 RepID=A0A1F4UYR7_UNCKA|nr:MAG: hypothetical protein ACD_19C00371G0001 [uncultured bacterium]OGC49363.1 MAG: hypothetical protein A3A69_02245 [candidate division WWE3 bacterium RIFCSPLOWO2_01_FULL_37_15]